MLLLDGRTGMERLTTEECLALLATDEIGRLGLVDFGTPVVLPVNYALDGDAIVFRTDPGTKLSRGQGARACFEVDAFDRSRRSGWSVVVTGRLEEVTSFDPDTLVRVRGLPIEPWGGGDKQHWMRLTPDRITGRRIPPKTT